MVNVLGNPKGEIDETAVGRFFIAEAEQDSAGPSLIPAEYVFPGEIGAAEINRKRQEALRIANGAYAHAYCFGFTHSDLLPKQVGKVMSIYEDNEGNLTPDDIEQGNRNLLYFDARDMRENSYSWRLQTIDVQSHIKTMYECVIEQGKILTASCYEYDFQHRVVKIEPHDATEVLRKIVGILEHDATKEHIAGLRHKLETLREEVGKFALAAVLNPGFKPYWQQDPPHYTSELDKKRHSFYKATFVDESGRQGTVEIKQATAEQRQAWLEQAQRQCEAPRPVIEELVELINPEPVYDFDQVGKVDDLKLEPEVIQELGDRFSDYRQNFVADAPDNDRKLTAKRDVKIHLAKVALKKVLTPLVYERADPAFPNGLYKLGQRIYRRDHTGLYVLGLDVWGKTEAFRVFATFTQPLQYNFVEDQAWINLAEDLLEHFNSNSPAT